MASISTEFTEKFESIFFIRKTTNPKIFFVAYFYSKWHNVCISIASELGKRTAALFIVEPNFDSAFWRKNNSVKAFNTRDEADLTFLFLSSYFLVKLYNFLWSDSETIIGQKNDRKVLIKREMMHFLYCTVWEFYSSFFPFLITHPNFLFFKKCLVTFNKYFMIKNFYEEIICEKYWNIYKSKSYYEKWCK